MALLTQHVSCGGCINAWGGIRWRADQHNGGKKRSSLAGECVTVVNRTEKQNLKSVFISNEGYYQPTLHFCIGLPLFSLGVGNFCHHILLNLKCSVLNFKVGLVKQGRVNSEAAMSNAV